MLNEQTPGIEWTHVYGRRGYTVNITSGCYHGCQFEQTDGSLVDCYASVVAARWQSPTFFPDGFAAHYFHVERLAAAAALKTPAGIFIDSMGDLFGHWLPAEQVQAVLDMCRQSPQHIFFSLTKNARRLREFELPSNLWSGISLPPDHFRGLSYTVAQKTAVFAHDLKVLAQRSGGIRWASLEPLSFDCSALLETAQLEWVVIGAATAGRRSWQPEPEALRNVLAVLDRRGIPVFFKGNLQNSLKAGVLREWRAEFPPFVHG